MFLVILGYYEVLNTEFEVCSLLLNVTIVFSIILYL